jgi:hypothetical protein
VRHEAILLIEKGTNEYRAFACSSGHFSLHVAGFNFDPAHGGRLTNIKWVSQF